MMVLYREVERRQLSLFWPVFVTTIALTLLGLRAFAALVL